MPGQHVPTTSTHTVEFVPFGCVLILFCSALGWLLQCAVHRNARVHALTGNRRGGRVKSGDKIPRVTAQNVTSLETQSHGLRDLPGDILLLSETSHRHIVFPLPDDLDMVWGDKVAGGQHNAGGVAFGLRGFRGERRPCTSAVGKRFERTGRLLLVLVATALGPLAVCVVYGFPGAWSHGPEKLACNEELLRAAFVETEALAPHIPAFLGGDFNTNECFSPFFSRCWRRMRGTIRRISQPFTASTTRHTPPQCTARALTTSMPTQPRRS